MINENWMIADSENSGKFSDSLKIFKDTIFADLHIHSKYSRATSTNLSFENLVKWAKIKGLTWYEASPVAISIFSKIAPTPIASAMVLATEKSSRMARPLITLYLFRFEYCNAAPKKNPKIKVVITMIN